MFGKKKPKIFIPPEMTPKPANEVLVTGESFRVIKTWTEEMSMNPYKMNKNFPIYELTADGRNMHIAGWQPIITIEQKNKNAMEEPYFSPVLSEPAAKMTAPSIFPHQPLYRGQNNDLVLSQHSNEAKLMFNLLKEILK